MPLDRLAKQAKQGVRDAGGFPIEFVTIAVSDGISMGHEGMRASLVSREVIADSVETVMHAERLDALVSFAGCDKSLPGMLMASARLNLPAVFVYGGSILPGNHNGQVLDIVSVFEAVGAEATGNITEAELDAIERNACPTIGSCAGMFTANTMAAIGRGPRHVVARLGARRRRSTVAATTTPAPPVSPSWSCCASEHPPASDPDQAGLRERHRRASWPSAAPPTPCCTCWPSPPRPASTCTSTTSTRWPPGCPTSPTPSRTATYHMIDLDRVGGVPMVMKELLDAGLLHGDCLTVTGKTMAENLAEIDPPGPDGAVVHRLSDPIHAVGRHRRAHRGRWPPRARW